MEAIQMKRYVALLRGINVSGKNKIPMANLKNGFVEIGFEDVCTYLNSGNVVFGGNDEDEASISNRIERMIKDNFNLDIPVFVTGMDNIIDIMSHAPSWWGTGEKEKYDNLIFIMPPTTAEEISEKIGEPTKELEQISIYKNVIFWTFDRKQYAKANWWKKTASVGIGETLTIRTANTIRKIAHTEQ